MAGPKTALVLSAGGMFGAWQAGAWKVLAGRFQPDVVVGASVGALNGWAIAGGADPDALAAEWLDPGMRNISKLRLPLAPWRGFLDSRALDARIRRLWAVYRPRTEVGVVAVEWRHLRPHLFRNAEIGWRHLAASCAVLTCYRQVRIEGRLYTDGGLVSVLPLWAAAAMGARRIVALNALPRMPSALVSGVVRGIRTAARLRPPPAGEMEVMLIAPEVPLGSLREALFWTRPAALHWIKQGERDARRMLPAWRMDAG